MTRRPDPRLARLAEIAAMVRDARLARLSAARAARDANIALHAALDPPAALSDDPADQLAALRHQRWAESRRARLMAEIARQDQVVEAERRQAARAVARDGVVGRLLSVPRPDQPS